MSHSRTLLVSMSTCEHRHIYRWSMWNHSSGQRSQCGRFTACCYYTIQSASLITPHLHNPIVNKSDREAFTVISHLCMCNPFIYLTCFPTYCFIVSPIIYIFFVINIIQNSDRIFCDGEIVTVRNSKVIFVCISETDYVTYSFYNWFYLHLLTHCASDCQAWNCVFWQIQACLWTWQNLHLERCYWNSICPCEYLRQIFWYLHSE